jgi:hypothetical protein
MSSRIHEGLKTLLNLNCTTSGGIIKIVAIIVDATRMLKSFRKSPESPIFTECKAHSNLSLPMITKSLMITEFDKTSLKLSCFHEIDKLQPSQESRLLSSRLLVFRSTCLLQYVLSLSKTSLIAYSEPKVSTQVSHWSHP